VSVALLAVALATSPAAVPGGVPVDPDAGQARSWAREELARPGYEREGLLARALGWFLEQLQRIPLPHGDGSALLAGVLLVVLVLLLVWALRRAGVPLARRRTTAGDGVFEAPVRTAAQYRAEADRAADAGDWRTAVLERFRAVVRELEERAVVPEQPGRTAGETAAAAGVRLPALAGALQSASVLFGDVRYGDRDATAASDAALRELDAAVRAARPASAVPTGAVG
jgi:hypothetical protein